METRIDMNSATLETLMTAPGMTPNIAKGILEGRPFISLDELLTVDGMTDELLQDIRSFFDVTTPKNDDPDQERRGGASTDRGVNVHRDINSTTQEALMKIPGMPPDVAKGILESRPFMALDELLVVDGMTEELLQEIRGSFDVATPKNDDADQERRGGASTDR